MRWNTAESGAPVRHPVEPLLQASVGGVGVNEGVPHDDLHEGLRGPTPPPNPTRPAGRAERPR